MGAKTHRLEVQTDRKHWQSVCDSEASDHSEALRKAIACLRPKDYQKPIRIQQVTDDKERGEKAT